LAEPLDCRDKRSVISRAHSSHSPAAPRASFKRAPAGRWRSSGLVAGLFAVAACAPVVLTPEQQAWADKGDCAQLLRAADRARVEGTRRRARALAAACTESSFDALLEQAEPAEALLWCGRASAVLGREGKPGCDYKRVGLLKEALRPKLSLGPPDPSSTPDPLLLAALEAIGPELNLIFAADPDVIVGKVEITLEEQTTRGLTTVDDPSGHRRQLPSVNHRLVARCTAQVELAAKTRTLRASEEARAISWEAEPRWKIPAHPAVLPVSDEELKERATRSWLRAVAKALWLSPPETVDTDDDRGCVAYGLALNASSGNPDAAANREGDAVKIARCEPLVGEPEGGGIPVP
jgi:hypothetical protein